MPRRSLTISAMRVTGTRRAMAILFMLSPRGTMNSSRRISPGCTGFSFLALLVLLVVIGDLNFVSVTLAPRKANTPLIVDADAILTVAIAFQSLQPVSRQGGKSSQIRRCVQHVQLAKRLPFDGLEPPHWFSAKEALGIGATEGADHL